MKKWILHILLIGILGTLAASCSQVMEDPISEGDCVVEKQKVMIRFTIALDAPKAASRTWAGDETQNDVTIDENYLNPNTVQVFVYDLNGILIGQLQDLIVTRQEDSPKKHIYDLVGGFEVDTDFITKNTLSFKLMVFGNCDPIGNLNNLETLTFTNPNTTTGQGIPMWGIATYNNVSVYTTVAQAQSNPLETPIYMLRSMAKIEVTLHEDMVNAGYTLDGATLSKSLTTGYVLPAYKDASGMTLTLKDLTATTNLGIDDVFHPVINGSNTTAGLEENGESTNTCIVYVPEYACSEGNLHISLTGLLKDNNPVKDNDESFKFVHGTYTTDGALRAPSDVIRNHYYKYTVNIDDGAELGLTCIVQEWTPHTETWDFTDNVTVAKDGHLKWTGLQADQDGTIIIPNTQEYTCTFNLLTPTDGIWQASLIPVGGQTDAFEFVGANFGTIGENGTGVVTLTVKAKYRDVFNENNAAKLRLFVRTKDGRTLVTNLTGNNNFSEYTLVQNVNQN